MNHIYTMQFTPKGHEYTIDTWEQMERLILSAARAALEIGELTMMTSIENDKITTILTVKKVEDDR